MACPSSMAKLFCALLFAVAWCPCASAWTLADIRLPPGGFQVEYFSRGVPNARSMALSTGTTQLNLVYVSTRSRRNIYAVIDENKDGVADAVHTLLDNLATPNGIAYLNGALFVAQVNRVLRFDGVDAYALRGEALPAPAVVSTAFPSDGSHGWKYIAFSPADGKLYVPVGAPCNVCEMQAYGSIGYGTINRMNADGSQLEVFASGIRNTVGFDWHPVTGELWFTDNGRDNMGDDFPDCELNVAPTAGMFFGYPYCHTAGRGPPEERTVGVGLPLNDPQLNTDSRVQCEVEDSHVRAVQALGPHTAPLGMKFYTGTMFPSEYRNAAFVAEHGSWNRAEKIGYRVSVVYTNANGTVTSRATFADGWLQGQSSYGRPVDVLQLPDGSLLISDDDAGAIYRISYGEGNPPPATSPPRPPPPLRSPPPLAPQANPSLPPATPSPRPPPATPSPPPPAAPPPPPSASLVPTAPWPPPIAAATLSPTSAATPKFEPPPGPPGDSLAEQKAIPGSARPRMMVTSMLAVLMWMAEEYFLAELPHGLV